MIDPTNNKSVLCTDFRNFVLAHAGRVAIYSFVGGSGAVLFLMILVRLFDSRKWGFTTLTTSDMIALSISGGMVWMALGGVISLGIRIRAWEDFKMEQFELARAHLNARQQPESTQQTKPETAREVTIKTTRGTAVIVQPRPAAFASWLRDVLNPDTKTMFSKNEAKRREWEDWQYINLVAQLKGIEWLHTQRTFNGAPDLDGQNVEEMRVWLTTPLL